jgi:glycosyltransferase involved in cell wall biosynthesis
MRERLSGGHPDDPLLLCVGRLSYEKRIDWLYAPVTQLPNVRLALVGSGPAEAELKKRFKGTNTVFTGYMAGTELASAYASSDVFAFPSDTETLGFVAMEAMASGTPTVGARAGGIPDVITEEVNGLMFTPGDLGDLTAKLKRLLFNEAERTRLAQAAREEMLRHDWHAATVKLVEFYEQAQAVHARFDPPSRY